jgi:hypothetical protein
MKCTFVRQQTVQSLMSDHLAGTFLHLPLTHRHPFVACWHAVAPRHPIDHVLGSLIRVELVARCILGRCSAPNASNEVRSDTQLAKCGDVALERRLQGEAGLAAHLCFFQGLHASGGSFFMS